ncbi:type II toxin-antitoxin system RelE/ParE family toxin [Thioalkalivibrio thiocyanodenitrificans]|uniref:type II toxin-antitoxin system RelE/ParE family toxin n=1 Tax=Thioalkalivibrio thiocyanodenitrificans TaxID=243063 RepID=UPI00036DA55F|nr:type II toxin-antitoxin system RelE/ParE family toxin [Thioalkalivibrio thiocyanodenitrificans]
MPKVIYSENALENLERRFKFLLEHDPTAAVTAADVITCAIDALKAHPLIGRSIESDIRELIISYGKSGYVALYRFIPARDQIRILAIRHQLELDYPP